jgi:hypothetical protein
VLAVERGGYHWSRGQRYLIGKKAGGLCAEMSNRGFVPSDGAEDRSSSFWRKSSTMMALLAEKSGCLC